MTITLRRIHRACPVFICRPVLAGVATAAVVLSSACGGSSADSTPTAASAPDLPTLAPTKPATTGPTAAASPSASASASPSVSPTVAGDQAGGALAAMTSEMKAKAISPFTLANCQAGNTTNQPCVELAGKAETVAAGLAEFAAGDPDGGPFRAFAGRAADGSWKYWFATFQPRYIPLTLPGNLIACRNEGTEVRAEPSANAASAGKLTRSTQTKTDQFVLTSAGSFKDGTRGEGWYHVTGSVTGWVNSRDVTDAALVSCTLRDGIEEPGTRG